MVKSDKAKRYGWCLICIILIGVTMSMHDIDKTHEERLNPAPNANDEVASRLAHGTTQNHNSKELATSDGLKFKERQIIARVGTVNKMVYGLQPNGTYGLAFNDSLNQRMLIGPDSTGTDVVKISKTGFDAGTTADANLIFNSNQNVFKIVGTGTSSCPALSLGSPGAGSFVSGTNNVIINHGLAYVPIVVASGLYSAGIYSPLPIGVNSGVSTHASWINYYVFADSTSIYFNTDLLAYGAAASASSLAVKYYLLQETAN